MHVAAEFGLEVMHPPVGWMRRSAGPSRAKPALNDKPGNHPVKCSVIVPAGFYEHQEVADGLGSDFGLHPDSQVTEGSLQDHILFHLLHSCFFERRHSLRLDFYTDDPNGSQRQMVVVSSG